MGKRRGNTLEDLQRMLTYAKERTFSDDWIVRMGARKDVERLEKSIKRKARGK